MRSLFLVASITPEKVPELIPCYLTEANRIMLTSSQKTARKQRMICTQKPFTQTQSLSSNQSNVNQKQQLIARWKTVNGKLVCQWITL